MPYYNYNTILAYDTEVPYDGFYSNIVVSVSTSYVTGMSFNPDFEDTTPSLDILRLYNGYPKLQDVVLNNSKVSVVGSKLAYKLTRNFWTTRL